MGLSFSGDASSTFGADTPFILIARSHIKHDQLEDYLKTAEIADAAVNKYEPGILHHTFDSDPGDPHAFVWSELYRNDASLKLTLPPSVQFVGEQGDFGDDFSIEVYGTLADETKKAFSAAGFPVKYFDTKFGYSRVATTTAPLQASSPAAFGAHTPFILITRCHAKPDLLEDYLEAAVIADAAVKESEPGMLHHTFDIDPIDPYAFVWSEVYKNDASLMFHLTNPPWVNFIEKHDELGDGLSIEVFGTLANETKKALSAMGYPIKYFDTRFGYSRVAASAHASVGGA
jgi:quinol monooxygenase YgiN